MASQLCAAVADSIGSAGIASEVSRGSLDIRVGFFAWAALATAVVWLTDPFQVVAVASQAFAVFHAAQCALALVTARRAGIGGWPEQAAFVILGLVSLAAALVGAPAEG